MPKLVTFLRRTLSIPVLALLACAALFATAAAADTLELKDGRVLQGKYLGGTQVLIRFEINGDVQTYRTGQIVAITFTGPRHNDPPPPPPQDAPPPPQASAPPPPPAPVYSSGNPNASSSGNTAPITSTDNLGDAGNPPPEAPPADNPPPPPAPQAPQPALNNNGTITIPAGKALLVRMIDGVDSKQNKVNDVFHASVETDLFVSNTLVARKGADIYGILANAKEAGHISGSSELELELTKIIIDGHDYPLVSSDYTLTGKGRGSDTAKKVGVGAVAGTIIGAIAGGGKGAAIGAGAGGAAGAGVQVLTRGQQVKVPSEALLEFRLQQPATVTPTTK